MEDDKTVIEELKTELQEKTLESTRKINDDHNVLVSLVNQMQEKSNRQTELIEMIHSLRKEVHELKQHPSR